MAATYSSTYELRFSGLGHLDTGSGVVDDSVNSQGSLSFPEIKDNRGSDSTVFTKLPTVNHYHDTIAIGKGASATIDFSSSSILDKVTGGKMSSATPTVTQAVVKISSPDGTKCIRMGQNADTTAVSFGIGSSAVTPEKAYQDRYDHFEYSDLYVGSKGQKVIINNPSASDETVTVALVLA